MTEQEKKAERARQGSRLEREQIYREAALDPKSSRELALTSFGIYAGMKLARDNAVVSED